MSKPHSMPSPRQSARSRLVMKFGSTSVDGAEAIHQVAQIVQHQAAIWDEILIVVSAMSGVTRSLLHGAQRAKTGDEQTYQTIVRELAHRHGKVAHDLLSPGSGQTQLRLTIDRHLDEYASLCHGVAVLGELPPRALDAITALGQHLSAHTVAAAVKNGGSLCQFIDAAEIIITDATFRHATPLAGPTHQKTIERIVPLLEQGVIPIVAGSVGATSAGTTTNLGPGGGNYSAAVLGDHLDATEVWIWTDQDGIMSADPAHVPTAHVIPLLSYTEVAELAHLRTWVLHPRAIRPLVERDIPLWIKNSFNPEYPGTRIRRRSQSINGRVKSVTVRTGLSMILIEGHGMIGMAGLAARLFDTCAELDVNLLMFSQSASEQSISMVVTAPSAQPLVRALRRKMAIEIARRDLDRIWALDDVALITAVGEGMRGTPGMIAQLMKTLAEKRINVISVAQATSECSISLVVHGSDAPAAVRQIHYGVIHPIESEPAETIPIPSPREQIKNWGTASVSELLGDMIVYRSLRPLDKRLPALDDIRKKLDLGPNRIPRKNDPDYARVLAYQLRAARKIHSPKTELERLIYLGDTQLHDGTAFGNLCRVGGWQGLAFIANETDAPLNIQTQLLASNRPTIPTIVLANRWSAITEFEQLCLDRDFVIDEATVIVVDLDKTILAARGRNDHAIDNARVLAVRRTVASLLGREFNQDAFRQAYDRLNQPHFHPFTADNQDYIAYICLIICSGLFELETVTGQVESGHLTNFRQFIDQVDLCIDQSSIALAAIHSEIIANVREGDPTPFKPFRANEYLTTTGRMGHMENNTPVEVLLENEVVITEEVRAMVLEWRSRGALVFGISDKPDEASIPAPEMAAKGYLPIHRTSTHTLGTILRPAI